MEEDQLLREAVAIYGRRWAEICAVYTALQPRTPTGVKDRWRIIGDPGLGSGVGKDVLGNVPKACFATVAAITSETRAAVIIIFCRHIMRVKAEAMFLLLSTTWVFCKGNLM